MQNNLITDMVRRLDLAQRYIIESHPPVDLLTLVMPVQAMRRHLGAAAVRILVGPYDEVQEHVSAFSEAEDRLYELLHEQDPVYVESLGCEYVADLPQKN